MSKRPSEKMLFIVVGDMNEIFDIILALKHIMVQKQMNFLVHLPKIYEYYIEIMKRLSEYMIQDISQHISFEDNEYIFRFDFVKIGDLSKFQGEGDTTRIFLITGEELLQSKI